ncbi:nucleotidyltransferase domain-containing protein [Streptomyces sp. NPDC060194]|uniref:nucleotidyltransferase domain-containing protein n=1 Tax=Streptomyces sp. NPDC060194 TaxID=3347069 RepID=UPI003648A862
MANTEPHATARALVADRHPEARAAFLAGSVLTSWRTPYSDLDIVVVTDSAAAPYRESLRSGGWPVELFVQSPESWREFFTREVAERRSPLMDMCAQGDLILDRDGVGAALAEESRRVAAAGPAPLTEEERDAHRYYLTDLLDDLAGCRDPGERLFVVAEIVQRTAAFLLLQHRAWLGGGKWLARRADEVRPGFAARLEAASRAAPAAGCGDLVALVDEVLAPAGGRLWEGYVVGRRTPEPAPPGDGPGAS